MDAWVSFVRYWQSRQGGARGNEALDSCKRRANSGTVAAVVEDYTSHWFRDRQLAVPGFTEEDGQSLFELLASHWRKGASAVLEWRSIWTASID